jgi:hypothetical protein
MMRWIAFVLDGDWRSFFAEKRNRVDLLLAVVTSIIQIPGIKGTRTYDWLTAFQLARFYRVIAAVPRMEALLSQVLGNLAGLSNMILFLLLSVGLAALVAVQLLRGDIPQEENGEHIQANFKQVYNGFLGMYQVSRLRKILRCEALTSRVRQVFTSENWTDVLYSAISNEEQYKQAVFAGILLCGWFLFANCECGGPAVRHLTDALHQSSCCRCSSLRSTRICKSPRARSGSNSSRSTCSAWSLRRRRSRRRSCTSSARTAGCASATRSAMPWRPARRAAHTTSRTTRSGGAWV